MLEHIQRGQNIEGFVSELQVLGTREHITEDGTQPCWRGGIGGCPNVGGICIGCTMPGFPDKFMPFIVEHVFVGEVLRTLWRHGIVDVSRHSEGTPQGGVRSSRVRLQIDLSGGRHWQPVDLHIYERARFVSSVTFACRIPL